MKGKKEGTNGVKKRRKYLKDRMTDGNKEGKKRKEKRYE